MKLPSSHELLDMLSREPGLSLLSRNQPHKALMRYRPGLDYYMPCLRDLGIVNLDTVLDAGCGDGQWAIAAALLNRRVIAVDHNLRPARFLGLDTWFVMRASRDSPLNPAEPDQAPRALYSPTPGRYRYVDFLAGALFCLIATPFLGLPRALKFRLTHTQLPSPWIPTIQEPDNPVPLSRRLWHRTHGLVAKTFFKPRRG